MLNLFALSTSDQSVFYLGQIFGLVGDVIPAQSVSNPNLLFGIMFKVFNTVALTIGAIILTYTTVIGVMATAHEGDFLGRKWGGAGAIWLPIRMVIGTAAVFPGASGYASIQIIIMWIIIQGIGAADTLWTATLNYLQQTGSLFSTTSLPTSSVTNNVEDLFSMLVCQETARATYPDVVGGPTFRWFCGDNPTSSYCAQTDTETYNVIDGPQVSYKDPATGKFSDTITYSMGPNGGCGSMTYPNPDSNDTKKVCTTQSDGSSSCQDEPINQVCVSQPEGSEHEKDWGPDSLTCLSYKGQQQALQSIVPVLSGIAKEFAMVDNQYVSWYETVVTFPGEPGSNGTPNANTTITPQPPDWIQSYCTQVGVSDPNKCCVYPNADTDPDHCGNGQCCKGPDPFGSPLSDNGSTSDASAIAVTNAYLPFAIQPYLSENLDFIESASNQFIQQAMTGPYQNYIADLGPTGLTNDTYVNMANDGWITAGSYYWELMQSNKATSTAIQPQWKTLPNSTPNFGIKIAYRYSNDAASTLIAAIDNPKGALQTTGLGAVMAKGNRVTSSTNDIIKGFISMISSKSGLQPIQSISAFGIQTLAVVQSLFWILVALGTALSAGAAFSSWITLGTGWTMNPIFEGIKALIGFFEPLFAGILIGFFSIGVMLGLYVPLIPFLIFMSSAIGWFIQTIEAMVAAPLVALGILSPGGQSELLGHGDKAVMILFNLFLRPTLMIFGLIAAILLSSQVIRMFNSGYAHLTSNILGPGHLGLVEQIVFISVYTALIVTIVSKIFALIHMIPERALTYIGAQAMSYGEADMLTAGKEAASGAAQTTASAGKGAGGAAVGGAETTAKAKKAEVAEQGEGQGNAGAGGKKKGAKPEDVGN